MLNHILRALVLSLMLWALGGCKGLVDQVTGATKTAPPKDSAALSLPGKGWTSETRRVKVVTTEGEAWKEITYYRNPMGMEFVLVPAGRFRMGSAISPEETAKQFGGDANSYADEHPAHEVRITKPFLMAACEVTNAQYRLFRADHSSGDFQGASLDGDAQPVTCIANDDARKFCEWLSRREGLTYRLPTEAEWEYACRAGSQARYPWGDKLDARFANVADVNAKGIPWSDKNLDDGFAVTAPAGSFPANGFGLYDMIGNVWEGCEDWYNVNNYANSSADDPKGPSYDPSMNRAMRGGSWMNDAAACRSACRLPVSQANRSMNNGFRLVVEIE